MGQYDQLTELLRLVGTLWITWFGGVLFSCVHSSLIGEIFAGSLAGPDALGLISQEDLSVVGNLGLSLLVFEGGMSVEISTIRMVGMKAFVIALTGTLLPLLSGWITLRILGFGSTSSFAGGTCLSSTSIGIATKLLQNSNALSSPLGNLITVTAITDDVLSLLILSVLTHVTNDSDDGNVALALLRPLLASFGVGCVGFFVAVYGVPRYVVPLLSYVHIDRFFSGAHVVLALVLATAMAATAGYAGSTFLLGIFFAGVAFAPIRDAAWNEKCSAISSWLSTIFFVSVGTEIPLPALLNGSAILKGLLLTVFAVLSKHVAGMHLLWGDSRKGRDRMNEWNVVGWALVGRGELGLVIGQTARDRGFLDDEEFAIVVFSIIVSTLLSPIVFNYYLRRLRDAPLRPASFCTGDSLTRNVVSTQLQDLAPLTPNDSCRRTVVVENCDDERKMPESAIGVKGCGKNEGGVEMGDSRRAMKDAKQTKREGA